MEIRTERLEPLILNLVHDIKKGYSKAEVSIALIDGVVITVSAYDHGEAEDCSIDAPTEANTCIEPPKGED